VPRVRAKRDAQRPAKAVEDRLESRLQSAFAHARGPQLHIGLALGEQPARGETRHDLLGEHRLQLVGRTGQHDEDFPVLLHPEARRRAVGVRQDLPALEDQRLLQIVRRHRAPEPLEPRRDLRFDRRVAHEFLPEHFRKTFPRAVVAGRPEPARRDHDVGPRPALAKLFHDRVRVVGDRDVAPQRDPAPAELSAHERQMAVGREPEQQLVAEREEFVIDLGDGFGRRDGVAGRNHTCEIRG